MLLWGTVEALQRVPSRWYRGLDCSIGEPQTGCPRLALLTAGIGTGSQCHTEIAVELVAVRGTSSATCIGGTVVASGGLASTRVGTGIADRAFAALSTAGLADSRSFPARVSSLHLQTKGQMWKAESLRVALVWNDQSHLHLARLLDSGHLAH